MPEISRFLGIVIFMYVNEHAPPHFHARYGGYEITVDIETRVTQGRFPPRALRAVLEWAEMHEAALLGNWNLLREGKNPAKVAPLE